jgi:hypothetical protein
MDRAGLGPCQKMAFETLRFYITISESESVTCFR